MENTGLIKVQCRDGIFSKGSDFCSNSSIKCSKIYYPKKYRCKNGITIIDWITYLMYGNNFTIINEFVSKKELSSFLV